MNTRVDSAEVPLSYLSEVNGGTSRDGDADENEDGREGGDGWIFRRNTGQSTTGSLVLPVLFAAAPYTFYLLYRAPVAALILAGALLGGNPQRPVHY